jgi:pSer/pThr/pTyr-binding forkhead associated (FHA) protein
MRPVGGGDPIPLYKNEVIVGRRPTSDVRLDFDNVSSKHCVLRLIQGVWHVRDLGSTNGTFVNRQKIDHEHGLMPDDELGIASHKYMIDYDPVSTVLQSKEVLGHEISQVEPQRQSLIERAGLDDDAEHQRLARKLVQSRSPESGFQDPLSGSGRDSLGSGPRQVSDEDFFRMIEEDFKKGR